MCPNTHEGAHTVWSLPSWPVSPRAAGVDLQYGQVGCGVSLQVMRWWFQHLF